MWSAPYDLSIDAARADALFASALQISDDPSAVQVRQAIDAATSVLGDLGCAARVAQEFGEHPETAAAPGARKSGQAQACPRAARGAQTPRCRATGASRTPGNR